MEAESIPLTQRRIVKVDRRFCPHCKRSVSIKTFKAHKRLYFDSSTNSWHHQSESLSERDVLSSDESTDSPPGSVGSVPSISADPDFSLDTTVSEPESDNLSKEVLVSVECQ